MDSDFVSNVIPTITLLAIVVFFAMVLNSYRRRMLRSCKNFFSFYFQFLNFSFQDQEQAAAHHARNVERESNTHPRSQPANDFPPAYSEVVKDERTQREDPPPPYIHWLIYFPHSCNKFLILQRKKKFSFQTGGIFLFSFSHRLLITRTWTEKLLIAIYQFHDSFEILRQFLIDSLVQESPWWRQSSRLPFTAELSKHFLFLEKIEKFCGNFPQNLLF